MRHDTSGPYIRWDNYGYEGWKPISYDTLNETLTDQRFASQACITKLAKYELKDITDD